MDATVALGRADVVDIVALVVSELVTNAALHGGGCAGVTVTAPGDVVRVEVADHSRVPPVLGHPSDGSLTGRGLRLVASLAHQWGAVLRGDGKIVWAEVRSSPTGPVEELSEEDLLAAWDDEWSEWEDELPANCFHVELGDVPTDLLLAAKAHVDNLVREWALTRPADDRDSGDISDRLRALLSTVEAFADARLAIKHQALAAQREGLPRTHLVLDLPLDAADRAEAYLAALDEIDSYCRAGRLLTMETPPQHRLFRHWYVGAVVAQLRALAAGEPPPATTTFEHQLLEEIDRMAAARRAAERTSRLGALAAALATAATPEAVAEAVLVEGVAALDAAAGGVLLATDEDRLALPGALGYDEHVLARLRDERRDAELPAAVALRTGAPVWMESRAERDARFPEMVDLERQTVSMCAVPLVVQDRRLGALRFSFTNERLFDQDERRFVLALAAQTAQALERSLLEGDRLDSARELQQSLLPPVLPTIDGVDVAAIYHPFGDGVEVGGDFYDLWSIGDRHFGLAIGDVSGTGLRAAALTALVRHSLRALLTADADPRAILGRLNGLLADVAESNGERFCTAIAGTVVVADGGGLLLRLASGGHPPIVVRRRDGTVEEILVGGVPLGLLDSPEFDVVELRLRPGDTAILYTDGVLEARRDGEMFDTAGIKAVVASATGGAQDVAAALEAAVVRHTGGRLSDDMAAVVVQIPG